MIGAIRAGSTTPLSMNGSVRDDLCFFLHADVESLPGVALQIRGVVEAGRVGGNFRFSYPAGVLRPRG